MSIFRRAGLFSSPAFVCWFDIYIDKNRKANKCARLRKCSRHDDCTVLHIVWVKWLKPSSSGSSIRIHWFSICIHCITMCVWISTFHRFTTQHLLKFPITSRLLNDPSSRDHKSKIQTDSIYFNEFPRPCASSAYFFLLLFFSVCVYFRVFYLLGPPCRRESLFSFFCLLRARALIWPSLLAEFESLVRASGQLNRTLIHPFVDLVCCVLFFFFFLPTKSACVHP